MQKKLLQKEQFKKLQIGNKIADKITSSGKTKSDGKKNVKEKGKEEPEIYTPPEKRQQIIDDLRWF